MTGFRSASRNKIHHLTVVNSIIMTGFFCFVTGSATFYKGNSADALSCFLPHDPGNLCCHGISPYRAAIYRSLSVCNRLCHRITSCISAAAAVISRKLFSYLLFFFINFYCKFFPCQSKEKSQKQSGTSYDHSRKYDLHAHPPLLLPISDWKIQRMRSPSDRL